VLQGEVEVRLRINNNWREGQLNPREQSQKFSEGESSTIWGGRERGE